MRRRDFITLLGGLAAVRPLPASAQRGKQQRRIGVLQPLDENDPEAQLRIAAFVRGLQQLGWKEGVDVAIDYRWGRGEAERTQRYAIELIGAQPDAIWAIGPRPLLSLKEATRSIPIVFTAVFDPVGSGFVASLTEPGGNITGFTLGEFSMGGKMLEILKEVAPRVKRVSVVLSGDQPPNVALLRAIETTAPSFGVRVTAIDVQEGPTKIDRAIEAFAREPDGGLIVLPSAITIVHRGTHHRPGGPAPPSRGLRISRLRRRWRTGAVRHRRGRAIPASCRLHRSHPQGREAGLSAGAAADQVRAGDQPQDREGAGPRHISDHARER